MRKWRVRLTSALTPILLLIVMLLVAACSIGEQPTSFVASAVQSPTATQVGAATRSSAPTNVPSYYATYMALKADKQDFTNPAWRTAEAMEYAIRAMTATPEPYTPWLTPDAPTPTWVVGDVEGCQSMKRDPYFTISCWRVQLTGELHIVDTATNPDDGQSLKHYVLIFAGARGDFNHVQAFQVPPGMIPTDLNALMITSVNGVQVNLAPRLIVHQGNEVYIPTVDPANPHNIITFDLLTHQFSTVGTPVPTGVVLTVAL